MPNFIQNLTSVWDSFKNTEKPIVLYGMGDGADKVLREFDRIGVRPYGVMASDGFVRYQRFHEFTVKSFRDFCDELGEFLIALCFGSDLPVVISYIRNVAHAMPMLVPSVPVYGSNVFTTEFYNANADKIDRAFALLSDDQSRKVFSDIISFEYTGELEYIERCTTEKAEAFDILNLGEAEDYLDLGAYRGDTIDEFLAVCGGKYSSITAFEPNPRSFAKLKEHCAELKNISLWQLGSFDEDTVMFFNTKSGRNSAAAKTGTPVQAAKADTILCGRKITYAKLDVEGLERQTIEGMRQTLKTFKPKLNVAAYHRGEDLFELILQLHEINPEYRFYLRHHPHILHWDTNIYAI